METSIEAFTRQENPTDRESMTGTQELSSKGASRKASEREKGIG
jgi:hypothetical protein